MPVLVPNVVGLSRTAAEAELDGLRLRHIAQFPFDGSGDGSAKDQSPPPGTSARFYSVVTVSYPTPFGPLDDSPVEGPSLSGTVEGQMIAVAVYGRGASLGLLIQEPFGQVDVDISLYVDQPTPLLLPRAEWMRRGAMLSLAQRALTNGQHVRLDVADVINLVQSIEISKP